jgi:hypothetical protein
MHKFTTLSFISLTLLSFNAISQEKTTLYYDENWKGLDTKKKALYYRVVTFNEDEKPEGSIETFYKSGKLRSKGEASHIDKMDDSKSVWKNHLIIYSEKGVKIFDQSYDDEGKAQGIWYSYTEKGDKKEETEFAHGNPAKDYYLVYEKGNPIKYSFLTMAPMKLSTTGKKLVPMTIKKTMYEDGQPIYYYSFNGVSIAVKFTKETSYGNYYAAYITVENGTDKEFNIDPKDFSGVLINNGKTEEAEILPYEYYIKKVNRRQAWSAAFNSFAQQQQASQAGYSAAAASGVAADNSGNVLAATTVSQNYNGAAQYNANQNAANQIGAYRNQQYNIKKSIAQGYLKINTIFPSSRIIGFVYIKYQKADGILLNIPVNGAVYQF